MYHTQSCDEALLGTAWGDMQVALLNTTLFGLC